MRLGMTDLDIAQKADMFHIEKIAEKIGVDKDNLELYGKYKAKLPLKLIDEEKVKQGKLVLVTAITPTPSGEGKTTTSVGLVDGLNKIGKKAMGVLREPSLGPVFGMKGGAAGGGYSQVVPMEDINLMFTGDFPAIEKANNLLSAIIDNTLHFQKDDCPEGNCPILDQRRIYWKRVFDMNDRTLRNIAIGLGGTANGVPREDGFNITAASEVMAILCLAENLSDLKERLGNIFVGYTYDGRPVYAKDFKVHGAMAALLKDAIKPNLVQTLENNPMLIHGGPFANIAHGANSIVATKMAMSLSDYVVTEAGFGADLGAEKFFDIKARYSGVNPSAVVLVVTARALKYHGSGHTKNMKTEDLPALKKGMANMEKHIENLKKFGAPIVVAINHFAFDSESEIGMIEDRLKELDVPYEVAKGWADGGAGMTGLAAKVVKVATGCEACSKPLYDLDLSIPEKIEKIAFEIYGASHIDYSVKAKRDLKTIQDLGLEQLPVCIAKTQKSFSDDAKRYGVPKDFVLTIREFEIAAGAGFIVPIAGNILRMPGLASKPSAENIDIDENGNISGLM
jgi:formate--tetrahydrofolate ligase